MAFGGYNGKYHNAVSVYKLPSHHETAQSPDRQQRQQQPAKQPMPVQPEQQQQQLPQMQQQQQQLPEQHEREQAEATASNGPLQQNGSASSAVSRLVTCV